MFYKIAINYENQTEIFQVKPIQQMRGFLKGIDTAIEREQNRVWIQISDFEALNILKKGKRLQILL